MVLRLKTHDPRVLLAVSNLGLKVLHSFPFFMGETLAMTPWMLAISAEVASLTESNSLLSLRFDVIVDVSSNGKETVENTVATGSRY